MVTTQGALLLRLDKTLERHGKGVESLQKVLKQHKLDTKAEMQEARRIWGDKFTMLEAIVNDAMVYKQLNEDS